MVEILRFLNSHKIDIIFAVFCIFLIFAYNYHISMVKAPIHDAAVYILNAHDWLANEQLKQVYRPPLLSWIIAGIWSVTGENWILVKALQAIFTVGAGVILYILLRKYKDAIFALAVTALTMTNGILFIFSSHILTEGLALFFLVLTLYFLKSQKENYWFLAGMSIGLTFASRYPIVFQALVFFIVESIINRKPRLVIRTILGTMPIIIIVILSMYLKTGTFKAAIEEDTKFHFLLSSFYAENAINIWGFVILLVPIALLHKSTYTDSFNYSFIAWFIFSFLFWSAHSNNFQFKFAIEYMPAVYFLSIVGAKNIIQDITTLYKTLQHTLKSRTPD
jgi:4-amino-4-deoxy-L-arabinose transferase-like glycosyltransferase